MIAVYTLETPPINFKKALFLAGNCPQSEEEDCWRTEEALAILEQIGYDGVVFVPLARLVGKIIPRDEAQMAWEKTCMDMADCIVFWAQRPGLTTNTEYGMYLKSGKAILGYPPTADAVKYLDWHAQREYVPVFTDLRETLIAAVERLGEGVERSGGEREVPLHIWRTSQFQTWYTAQKAAGHRIEHAQFLWHYRVGKKKEHVYAYAIRFEMYIPSEDRIKAEVVLARPDTCSVVAHCPPVAGGDPLDTEILLIRECRLAASVGDCFVREVPSGSTWKKGKDPKQVAADEQSEETGLEVDVSRLRYLGARQLASTFSSHQAHVFASALTLDEMAQLKAQWGTKHGIPGSEEQTYIEVYTLRQLLQQPLTDWSNLGMIFASIMNP
jgi:hypothetical protein